MVMATQLPKLLSSNDYIWARNLPHLLWLLPIFKYHHPNDIFLSLIGWFYKWILVAKTCGMNACPSLIGSLSSNLIIYANLELTRDHQSCIQQKLICIPNVLSIYPAKAQIHWYYALTLHCLFLRLTSAIPIFFSYTWYFIKSDDPWSLLSVCDCISG